MLIWERRARLSTAYFDWPTTTKTNSLFRTEIPCTRYMAFGIQIRIEETVIVSSFHRRCFRPFIAVFDHCFFRSTRVSIIMSILISDRGKIVSETIFIYLFIFTRRGCGALSSFETPRLRSSHPPHLA